MLNPVFSIAHMRQISKDFQLFRRILQVVIDVHMVVPIFYEVTHKVCFSIINFKDASSSILSAWSYSAI
jgi:hypothetical protein